MSAVVQVHSHKCIARLKHGKENGHICLCSGMGLNIDILTAKQLFRALFCQIFGNIHALASAIISLARIPLCILVRQRASHRSHNSLAHPVLRCDQLNV